jgi:hypothetical protein
LTLPPTQRLYDALAAPGGEITVTQTIRYIDSSTETVPLGVFVVDQDQIGYAPGDTLTLTCPDRWVIVQRNRFSASARSSVPSNTHYQEIQRLVEGAWPNVAYPFPGWASLDTTATTKVGPLLWADGARDAAVTGLAGSVALEVFFDQQGKAVLRPVPVLTATSPSVWTVNPGDQGVMIGANRSRDRSRTRNAVIVTTSATDIILAPGEKKNTTSSDPLSVVGPLGYVPFYYSSPTIRNATQRDAVAVSLLSKQLGVAKQLTLEAAVNGALDASDVISVPLPRTDESLPRPVELHIIDSGTVPLLPTGTQTLQTRSTRPTSDDSGGS